VVEWWNLAAPPRWMGPDKQILINNPAWMNMLASFPGLHAQLLSLAVRKVEGKAWKDLSRDVCRC